MPTPRQLHRASTRGFSLAMIVLGALMVALTLARGGGPTARGILLGVLFAAAGAARLYLQGRG